MGLREVLAEIDVEVRGLGDVEAASVAIDRFVDVTKPAISEFEALRLKQTEAFQTAGKLLRRIKKLQKAEGDNSEEIKRLRIAYIRTREQAKQFGAEADKVRVRQESSATSATKLAGAMGFVGIVIGAVAAEIAFFTGALGTFNAFLSETAKLGNELAKTSRDLGISSDVLQEWQFIAERSGVSASDLTSAFDTLSDQVERGFGPWERLGVVTRDASGQIRETDAIFGDVITSLGGVENAVTRTRIAQQIFGGSGEEMLKVVEAGGPALEELRQRFNELGGGLSGELVQSSKKAEDAMVDFRLAMLSLRKTLAIDFLPGFGDMISKIGTAVSAFRELVETTSIMETVLGLFAAAAVAVGISLTITGILPTMLLITLTMAALFLVVEDVVTAFRGGESVFGSFAESMLAMMGLPVTFAGFLDLLGIAWLDLKISTLDSIVEILRAIAQLQAALGVEVFQGLGGVAGRVAEASRAAGFERTSQRKQLIPDEAGRRRDRAASATERAAPVINAEITVNDASDPVATGRAVKRIIETEIRSAMDGEALAEA